MRRRTLIRTAFFLGSTCLSIWQLPNILARYDGLIGGAGIGGPTAVRASDLPPGTPVERATPEKLVVFSPDGRALTPSEAEALRERAARLAPINKVADAPPKPEENKDDPGNVQIGAPNPQVEELLKQLTGAPQPQR